MNSEYCTPTPSGSQHPATVGRRVGWAGGLLPAHIHRLPGDIVSSVCPVRDLYGGHGKVILVVMLVAAEALRVVCRLSLGQRQAVSWHSWVVISYPGLRGRVSGLSCRLWPHTLISQVCLHVYKCSIQGVKPHPKLNFRPESAAWPRGGCSPAASALCPLEPGVPAALGSSSALYPNEFGILKKASL